MFSKSEKHLNGESCSLPGNSKSFSPQKTSESFHFKPPPEAPIFYPSEEEFQNPLVYIETIRPIAENMGICKIKPPPNWQPPFAVDVDKLKFTPRVQRINELEAKTRIKLNFLDQIAKFWELQGSSLKIPIVERRALDLYTLHKIVQTEGGFDFISKEGRWPEMSERMGYQAGRRVGLILKAHYERLLYPFDLFKQGKTLNLKIKSEECDYIEKTEDHKECPIRIRKSSHNDDIAMNDIELQIQEGNRELKRLQFYGAGPKMPGFKNKSKKGLFDPSDPLSKYVCQNCNSGESEEQMLLCDGCDDSYHTFCLVPPLVKIPKGDWRCPRCVAEEVSKPTEAFGFHQAQREYTLQQFGDMADQFKSEYFKMPGHTVPTDKVEKEYWRIVSSIDEDVTVEYGADLHTMDHGSGFPTKSSKNLFPGDKEYADSNWNLNNLPVSEGSVLRYIDTDVSGMTVPWMYVGMCFATFCWHNEDHWTYSINYMHWGDAKTWYGVPGNKAEFFEERMKSAAPELFYNQPDLLHQLVTIMNPNILMNAGVPIYRTDQQAGEFVITFPRAYHAGFNQGYNFAEAVNFALPDWLRKGRDCVLHYSNLRRFCVFSHDELVCGMAQTPDKLDPTIAAATYQDMLIMVDTEKRLRKILLDWGVTKAERASFENLPDDERQCEICKTTCFLSAVACSCSTDVLVCLRHYKALCECLPQNKTLKYRYTLDEITVLLKALKLKAQSFDPWVDRVKKALDPKTSKTFSLQQLEGLLLEASDKQFPEGDLLKTLTSAVEEAKKCAMVIQQLEVKKRENSSTKYKLTVEELKLFCEEVDNLVCTLEEGRRIQELLKETTDFEQQSAKLLSLPLSECSYLELEKCQLLGNNLFVELPNLRLISLRIKQHRWLRDLENYNDKFDVMDLKDLKDFIKNGSPLTPCPEVEKKLSVLQELLSVSENWEKEAKEALISKGKDVLLKVDKLLKEASKISCLLPSESTLIDGIKEARTWLKLVETVNSSEYYPDFDKVEELVKKAESLSLHLTEVDQMKECLQTASQWKEKTSEVFLRTNSNNLMKVLSPRTSLSDDEETTTISLSNVIEPEAVSKLFKTAEETEISLMKKTSANNSLKSLDPNDNSTFCKCGKGLSGIMLRCDLCKDWSHFTCLNLPKTLSTKYKDSQFLCPCCQRTKRPKLEVILNLLMSLQQLHVRVPEGEALQYLTERAISWQERVNQFLQHPELESLKNQITALHRKCNGDSFDRLSNGFTPIKDELKKQLEELCFEGNLLEVSLDEQHSLWNLVQSYRDPENDPILIDFDGNMNNAPYKKGCKRLSEEIASSYMKIVRID